MASLSHFSDRLAVCTQDQLIVINERTTEIEFSYLSAPCPENDESSGDVDDEGIELEVVKEKYSITQCLFSSKGNFLSICTSNKLVLVWKTYDWSLILKKKLCKKPTKIIFTRSEEYILVADKTGDIYRIDVQSGSIELILGHLSTVLDMCITFDDKILITSDKDKKVRLSCFPNCYNIVRFLLYHKNFVSCLGTTLSGMYLVTGGRDGCLVLWNYVTGLQCDMVKLDEKEIIIPKSLTIDQKMNVYVIPEGLMKAICYTIIEGRFMHCIHINLEAIPLRILCAGDKIVILQNSKQEPIICLRKDSSEEYCRLPKCDTAYLETLNNSGLLKEPKCIAHWC